MISRTRVFAKVLQILKLNQFIRFSIIGGLGYLVDIGIFFLIIQFSDVSVYIARLLSALCTASFTWYGNRLITFRIQKRNDILREWFDYIYAMIPGIVTSYSIFFLIVYIFGEDWTTLIFAVSLGVIIGSVINFILAKKYVFRGK